MFDIIDRVMERAQNDSANGIWPHSRPDQYFIFCVGQNPILINGFMSWAYNSNIGIKPLIGMYKGAQERSFISNYDNFELIKHWLSREETVLILSKDVEDGDPKAVLHYLGTCVDESVGHLRQAARHTAIKKSSWTLDPLTGCYYVTE